MLPRAPRVHLRRDMAMQRGLALPLRLKPKLLAGWGVLPMIYLAFIAFLVVGAALICAALRFGRTQ